MAEHSITTEEIDALMQAVQAGHVGQAEKVRKEPHDRASRAGYAGRTVKPYDFSRPDRFSREQVRALELVAAGCARGMSTQLGTLLRAPVDVDVESVEETSYAEFLAMLAEPASLALLHLDPLPGRGLLHLDPAMAFAMIDRLLGGQGVSLPAPREFTDLEKSLVGRIVERVSQSLAQALSGIVALEPDLEMIIGGTLFSQVASPEDRIVAVCYRVTVSEKPGRCLLGIPTASLDSLLAKLSAQPWLSTDRPANGGAQRDNIRQTLDRTELDLTVDLGSAGVTVRDLLDLQTGDMVWLDSRVGDSLGVRVGPVVRFRGQPGQVGRRLGIRITDIEVGEE